MLQQHSEDSVRTITNNFYQDFDYERLPGIEDHRDYRTPFQIDRDRIAFSGSFRRLQSKTQVFRSGEYDFYRTRLTHSIEVARIGHSICDFLKATSPFLSNDYFIDPDLVEALGLAHDLGHPPFGHIGERKLNDLVHTHGGFEGNAQTLRIITELIYNRDTGPHGMSPTRALLDGLCKYKVLQKECIAENRLLSQRFPGGQVLGANGAQDRSACAIHEDPSTGATTQLAGWKTLRMKSQSYPDNHFLYDNQEQYRQFIFNSKTLPTSFGDKPSSTTINSLKSIECQIMDWADDTAYSMHDIVDGIQAGFLSQEKIERWAQQQESFTPIQNEALERLFESIHSNKLEGRFAKQIGTFIRACRLKERKDPNCPLAQSTHRYRFTLEIDPNMAQECNLYQKSPTTSSSILPKCNKSNSKAVAYSNFSSQL